MGTRFRFFLVFFSTLVSSCIHNTNSTNSVYDLRPITIQTISLFNQRQQSKFSKKSWRGDWIFRRERIDLIDKNFQSLKPDILLVQESMSKKENASESDRNLLLAGALKGYDWYLRVVQEHDDTQEVESMATAVALPLKINRSKILSGRELWDLGHDGFMVVSIVDSEGGPFTVFNMQMPDDSINEDLWYRFAAEKIKEKMQEIGTCKERVIVGGYITGSTSSKNYLQFLDSLELKDSSKGFCEQEEKCFTATSSNELLLASKGDIRPERLDRILVNARSQISTSKVVLNEPGEFEFSDMYGISALWPSQRYSWFTEVRFLKCSSTN